VKAGIARGKANSIHGAVPWQEVMKSRLPLVVLAGSVGLFLVVGWLSLSTADFGAFHDDGIYTVTARSLAVTGEYRITSLPGEPYQRKYPIVFPAVLAAVWRIAGDFPANIVWLKAVSLLAGAVFLSLTFGLLRNVGASAWTAAVITGVCAVMPATGESANQVMSELLYGAISIAALWLLERAVRGNPSPGLGLAAGLVAGLAYQTRSVGLALVLAMILMMACQRRWRVLMAGMVGVGLTVGVCKLWQGPASEVPLPYEYYVNYGDWFLNAVHDLGWRFFAIVPLKNLVVGVIAVVRTALPEMYDLSRSAPKQIAVAMAGLLLLSALIPGWIRRRHEAWAIYLLLYIVIYLVWPYPPVPRFFVPVLPLILLAMWEGFQSMRPSPRLVQVTATIACVIVGMLAVAGGYVRLTEAHVKPSLHRYDWIRINTAPGDVIASVLDPNCYLYTGRKAVSIATLADMAPYYGPQGKFQLIRPEGLAEMVRTSNAIYVMVDPVPRAGFVIELAREVVGKIQQESPGQLEEVWHDDSEEATIYRVREVKSAKGTPLSLR
jgi:4-amino-4-deoxy-L-arabinose transferase-like glycosyltransferase